MDFGSFCDSPPPHATICGQELFFRGLQLKKGISTDDWSDYTAIPRVS